MIARRPIRFNVNYCFFYIIFLVGRNNFQVTFSKPFPAYIFWPHEGCCRLRNEITLTMWFLIQQFPATLFSIASGNEKDPPIVLTILSDGKIKLFFKGENARLVVLRICKCEKHSVICWAA